jgi:uncharacterized phage infection (PIP) family protein YhgE
MYAVKEVRRVFIKYVTNNAYLLGDAASFLQYEDSQDEVFQLDDEAEMFTKYAFVNVASGVKRARQALSDSQIGFQNLLEGFDGLTTLLHRSYATSSELSSISLLVVGVTETLIEWVGELRRWEDVAQQSRT